jgi:hypothetical protein
LYSTAALVDASGNVAERYEYDAYGQVHILDANFADDADGVSDCGNPYMFQGKRLDLLDNGGLELMSWPYRDYSMYLGRWYQAEKLGMIPNDDEEINPFFPQRQYEDGLNCYGSFSDSPFGNADRLGLKVCCKTVKHVRRHPMCGIVYGGPYCVRTPTRVCDQEEIANPHDCSPEQACCYHYKDNPAVTVYGAYEHDEGCCWCQLYSVLAPGLFGHNWLHVVCEQATGTWAAHIVPPGGAAGVTWSMCVVGVSVTVDVRDNFVVSPGYASELQGRVSCDVADWWHEHLDGRPARWSCWYHCRHFVSDTRAAMLEDCDH